MTPATPKATEARRVKGNEVETGGNVRLFPGGPVQLLNVSETGALVESRHRLATGTSVVLSIGGERPQRLQGEVVRSAVTAIHRDSTMTYQLGIAFHPDSKFEGIPEPPEPEAVSAPVAVPDAPPAAEPTAEPAVLVNEW